MSVSEEIAALRADLDRLQRESETILRVNLERVQKEKREPMQQRMRQSLRGFGGKGRWAHPSTRKVVAAQLIVGELLLRLWASCGHVG